MQFERIATGKVTKVSRRDMARCLATVGCGFLDAKKNIKKERVILERQLLHLRCGQLIRPESKFLLPAELEEFTGEPKKVSFFVNGHNNVYFW